MLEKNIVFVFINSNYYRDNDNIELIIVGIIAVVICIHECYQQTMSNTQIIIIFFPYKSSLLQIHTAKTLQKINIHSFIVFFSLHIQYRYRTPYMTTFFIFIPQKYYILLQQYHNTSKITQLAYFSQHFIIEKTLKTLFSAQILIQLIITTIDI